MIYIALDRNKPLSLRKQLYLCIKKAILDKTLLENEKLPSSRELATNLNVSRNVVIDAYDQLIAEGYLYTIKGSGSYVMEGVCFEDISNTTPIPPIPRKEEIEARDCINFRTGVPDLSAIPIKKWGQLYKKMTQTVTAEQLDYHDPLGSQELRHELSLYLNRVRGVVCSPENLLITNGAAQAFSLLKNIVSADEYVLVENPLSRGLLETLQANHLCIKPNAVDQSGLLTSRLPANPPKLIFTTPSHQFPTGSILPIRRRIELIQYAKKNNCYIIEDDYDSEFRFDGPPIQSMQSLDPNYVIYVGTFSKTLMPALRLGYMVLPPALCEELQYAKYIADIHSLILDQLTLAVFLRERYFDAHIKKMRSLYLKREII